MHLLIPLVFLLQLHVILGNYRDPCLILKKHPGSCLYFLTDKTYTYDEGKKECWNRSHSVVFVPESDDDVADLLGRFYFHVANDTFYEGHLGTGIISDTKGNKFRENLYNVIGKDIAPSYGLWNDVIYGGNMPKNNGKSQYIFLNYPGNINPPKNSYLRIDLKKGTMVASDKAEKSYFACHAPRYPKYKCPKGAFTDYESRTCMWFKNVRRESTNRAEATELCKLESGNLASIHDEREYNIYWTLIGGKNKKWTEEEKKKWDIGTEYWFGLRHQNDLKTLGQSRDPGFDERYLKGAYFVDGTKYTGFHRFHANEPTAWSNQANYNGQTLALNGWYRNFEGSQKVDGGLCRSTVDITGVY